VILICYPGNARNTLARAVVNVVREQNEHLQGAFVVMQPGQVRISEKPSGE